MAHLNVTYAVNNGATEEDSIADQLLNESMGENEEALRQAAVTAPPDLTVQPTTLQPPTAVTGTELDPSREFWDRMRPIYQNRLSWITIHSGFEYERKFGCPVTTVEVTFKSRATFNGERKKAEHDQQLLEHKLRELKDSSLSSLLAFSRSKIDERTKSTPSTEKQLGD